MIQIRKIHDSITPQIEALKQAFGGNGQNKIIEALGRQFLAMSRQTFGAGGKWRGNVWAPLTEKDARKYGGNRTPTLLRSRALFQSLKLGIARRNKIEIYSTNPHAAPIFFGSQAIKLPPRRYLPIVPLSGGNPNAMGNTNYRMVYSADNEMERSLRRSISLITGGVAS